MGRKGLKSRVVKWVERAFVAIFHVARILLETRPPHSSRLPLLHLNASDGRKMHAIFSMWECFIVRVRACVCADREGSRGILEERGVSRTMIKISNKIRELREIDTFVT